MELTKFDTIEEYITLAVEQSAVFGHKDVKYKQAYKQAVLLYLADHNVTDVYVKALTRFGVSYSTEPIDGFTPGKAMTDVTGTTLVVSNGLDIRAYRLSTLTKLPGGLLYAESTTRRFSGKAHDGRASLTLSFGEYSLGTNRTVNINSYLIQNLLWNKESRDMLFAALVNQDIDSTKYVVNHKNNDSRDLSYDNLELVSLQLNKLHGEFIQMLASSDYSWLLGPDYYTPKSELNGDGYWKHTLICKLSAYDVADFINGNAKQIIDKYGLKVKEV